jgi:hypothetical protein
MSAPRRFGFALWLAASAFLVFVFFDDLWSMSGDMSAHDFTVNRLMDNWGMSDADERTLYGATLYPRLSFIVAAALGAPVGSAVVGMQLTSLLAMIALWSGFALILRSLPARQLAIVVGAALLGLLLVNRQSA